MVNEVSSSGAVWEKKKRGVRKRTLAFNETSLHDFVTCQHKRKNERRAKARTDIEREMRRERKQFDKRKKQLLIQQTQYLTEIEELATENGTNADINEKAPLPQVTGVTITPISTDPEPTLQQSSKQATDETVPDPHANVKFTNKKHMLKTLQKHCKLTSKKQVSRKRGKDRNWRKK